MNIRKILDEYTPRTVIARAENNDTFIGLPFFHRYKRDEGILIRITETAENEIVLSDGHTTLDYSEEQNVDIRDYPEKADSILTRFGMTLDGNVLRLKFRHNDDTDITRHINYFIQSITLVANIDL